MERVRVGDNAWYVNVLCNWIKIRALGKIRKECEQVVIQYTSMYYLNTCFRKHSERVRGGGNTLYINVLPNYIKICALGKIGKRYSRL